MKLFAKIEGCAEANLLDDFRFLCDWRSLTLEEKLRKYEKFGGHEFNLFLYFKDQKFYENVVKSH